MKIFRFSVLCAAMYLIANYVQTQPWPHDASSAPLSQRIAPPRGFKRVPDVPGGFAAWLRNLPLKNGRPEVRFYNGRLKSNQNVHCAVVDMDVGTGDLQQCADAVMRLRAEYLLSAGREEEISFLLANGGKLDWMKWKNGEQTVSFLGMHRTKRTAVDGSYRNFRKYMNAVFSWANTVSLDRQLVAVKDPETIEPGDVFIKPGNPGHAVLVVDVAQNVRKKRVFLLAQSYMPAQEFHVLKNPKNTLGPWYEAQATGTLETPEWVFDWTQLKRFSRP